MLRNVVRGRRCRRCRRRRRRWAHAPVIHAASHFYKSCMGLYFYACMWSCSYSYGAPLGSPSGRRSSAINLYKAACAFQVRGVFFSRPSWNFPSRKWPNNNLREITLFFFSLHLLLIYHDIPQESHQLSTCKPGYSGCLVCDLPPTQGE